MPGLQLTPAAQFFGDLPLTDRRGKRTVHANLQAAILVSRGAVIPDLKHDEPGATVNQDHGWGLCALLQVAQALQGGGHPPHAGQLDTVADALRAKLRRERWEGLCSGEVLSSTYLHAHSATYLAGQWWACCRLLQDHPESRAVRALMGELIAWFRQYRYILHLSRVPNGLIYHPGIRVKHDPKKEPSINLWSDAWHEEVTYGPIREALRRLVSPDDAVRENRTTELVAHRLATCPEGRLLEQASRNTVAGRLKFLVGWKGGRGGALECRMPEVEIIWESAGKTAQVVWDVLVDGSGAVLNCTATNFLAHPESLRDDRPLSVGQTRRHPDPDRRHIPAGWEVLGPHTPIPDAPPWKGELGGGSPPPEKEEAVPKEPEAKVPHPRVAKDSDLRSVQLQLEKVRDEHPSRAERRWADRSLKKLNKAGAWEWEEGR